jgi:hypothetical protein
MARPSRAPDAGGVQSLRSAAMSGHRAFAVLVGTLIVLSVAVSFAYAAAAGV